jgi:hypothetical protein
MNLTADDICRALWNCPARHILPDSAHASGIYLDPQGPSVRVCQYRGELRGWPVRRMDGSEPVVVTDEGNRIAFAAESWVLDRIGESISGREAATLRRALAR